MSIERRGEFRTLCSYTLSDDDSPHTHGRVWKRVWDEEETKKRFQGIFFLPAQGGRRRRRRKGGYIEGLSLSLSPFCCCLFAWENWMDPIQSSRRLYYIPLFLLLLQKRRNPITFLVYSAAGAFSYFPFSWYPPRKRKTTSNALTKPMSLSFFFPLSFV